MATYLILGLVVILGTIPAIVRHRKMLTMRHVRQFAVIATVLFVLTAVFDNLIVGFGIVAYDLSRISEIYVGLAPIEDFFYPLLAAYLIPILWSGK